MPCSALAHSACLLHDQELSRRVPLVELPDLATISLQPAVPSQPRIFDLLQGALRGQKSGFVWHVFWPMNAARRSHAAGTTGNARQTPIKLRDVCGALCPVGLRDWQVHLLCTLCDSTRQVHSNVADRFDHGRHLGSTFCSAIPITFAGYSCEVNSSTSTTEVSDGSDDIEGACSLLRSSVLLESNHVQAAPSRSMIFGSNARHAHFGQ